MSTVVFLLGLVALGSSATRGPDAPDEAAGAQPATDEPTARRGRRRRGKRRRRGLPRISTGPSPTLGGRLRAVLYLVTVSVAIGIAVAAAIGLIVFGAWVLLDRSLT